MMNGNGYIVLIDARGEPTMFRELELYEQLKAGGFTLFGFGMEELAEFRRQYMLKSGQLPATKETIKAAFINERVTTS